MYQTKNGREVMLFDHEEDPDEAVNVAQEKPDLVSKLVEELREQEEIILPGL